MAAVTLRPALRNASKYQRKLVTSRGRGRRTTDGQQPVHSEQNYSRQPGTEGAFLPSVPSYSETSPFAENGPNPTSEIRSAQGALLVGAHPGCQPRCLQFAFAQPRRSLAYEAAQGWRARSRSVRRTSHAGQVLLELKAQDVLQRYSAADWQPAASKSCGNSKGRSDSNRLHNKHVLHLATEI